MTTPLLQLHDIIRIYHTGDVEVRALNHVSLSVEQGEFVAIVGASGSGKSTLMAILGCLDRPTGGQYWFEGTDVATLPDPTLARIRSERLGFVFQSFNLLARTSAVENVALPLYYATQGPVSSTARQTRAQEALARLGLAGREQNTPSQLSGGQQQRVAIARALINAPDLLLADEPTGNLDTRTSHEIMKALADLNRTQGVTVIVITHEADIAAYADRVLTMRDGEIVSDQRKTQLSQTDTIPRKIMRDQVHGFRATPVLAFGKMIMGAALQALTRNRMRSVLTILGVFIGVAALVAMVAVGQGANQAVRKQIESLGTSLLVVLPGAATSSGAHGGFGSASTLTVADAAAIKRQSPDVSSVSYVIRSLSQIRYGNQNWASSVMGVSLRYTAMTNWTVSSGRMFTATDEERGALVALIGRTVYREIFPAGETPIGATILVRDTPLRVIGLLASKGQTAFGQDQDDVVMMPFTTAEQRVLGAAAPTQQRTQSNWPYPPWPNPYGLQPRLTGYVNQLYVQATSPLVIGAAMHEVTQTLMVRHQIKPGAIQDFSVHNLSQIAEAAQSVSRVMALLLAAVASISLLVGGIGIMNILLVSVAERTREIGLRMAIGAQRLHVLLQFLAEAVFLSVTGGLAGILLGITMSAGITFFAGWPAPVSFMAIAGGFLFSVAVGIFFGLYPARKAARLNPIEALRYE
ncbi:ABC transporter permease [Acidocella sp.]|uniref:ABC transporter permease n=1 Tax=Acidocella sp. TaxID=50710 RepID=UPI0026303C45|nr:ABC transporter permease [Acidocella sp.]